MPVLGHLPICKPSRLVLETEEEHFELVRVKAWHKLCSALPPSHCSFVMLKAAQFAQAFVIGVVYQLLQSARNVGSASYGKHPVKNISVLLWPHPFRRTRHSVKNRRAKGPKGGMVLR